MPEVTFEFQMDYLLAVYGFSFIFLSIICFFLHENKAERLPFLCFGIFTFSTGISELAICIKPFTLFPEYVEIVRFFFNTVSMLAIFEFGRRSLSVLKITSIGAWIYILPLLLSALGWIDGTKGYESASLYVFLITGSFSASYAFYMERGGKNDVKRYPMILSSIAMFLYGILMGVFVPKANFFPASSINSELFRELFGLPLQGASGICAMTLTAGLTWYYFSFSISAPNLLPTVRRIPFKKIYVPIIFCILLAGLIATDISGRRTDEELRLDIISNARVVAEAVNMERIPALKGNSTDLCSEAYLSLKRQLAKIKEISSEYRFIYLMKVGDDSRVSFLVDSEPHGSKDCSPPGRIWNDAPRCVNDLFSDGEYKIVGPYTDRWGTWLSCFAPVKMSRTGETVAILGMDMSATKWNSTIYRNRLIPIILTILFMTVTVSVFLYSYRMLISNLIISSSEKALNQSKERFKQIAEQTREMIWEVDAGGLYTYVSKGAEFILGYKPEEIVGKMHLYDFHPEDESEKMKRAELDVFMNKDAFKNFVTPVNSQSGETKLISRNGVPFLDGDGNLLGYRGSDLDITESLRKEEMLRHSQKMEAIGQLAGGIAHDFNNLLTVISGYAQVGLKKTDASSPFKKYFGEIKKASDTSASLTKQILMFSRNQPVAFKTIEINSIVLNMQRILRRLIAENIKIEIKATPDVWTINGDPSNIEQIIMNLAVNANDAMPDGGTLIIMTENITVDEEGCSDNISAVPGRYVRLSVCDNGTGMDKETINRIFEPFFTTKGLGRGTGLGLSVVYGIVKHHKGWVDVESTPGKGTAFKIYFPFHYADEDIHVISEQTATATIRENVKILFIEDEPGLRNLAKEIFETDGWNIVCADSGKVAREVFSREKGRFSLVISDVVLTDCNGLDLVEEFKKINPEIKVILASGYSDEKSRIAAIHKRGFIFIQKPYDIEEMKKTVKSVMLGLNT